MDGKLERVLHLYAGWQTHEYEALVNRYFAPNFTEHASRIADGIGGYLKFVREFLEAHPGSRFEVVRSIVDGPYVFVHVRHTQQGCEASRVIADIFEADQQNQFTGHWQLIQEEVKDTLSGRSMTDGPVNISDLEKTEANRSLIRTFMDEILIGEQLPKASKFISETRYDQHNPLVKDGLQGLFEHYQEFVDNGVKARYQKAYRILVEGNFAVTYSHATLNDVDWCYVDIFRIERGKIVEHWDVQEKVPPRSAWCNDGMLA